MLNKRTVRLTPRENQLVTQYSTVQLAWLFDHWPNEMRGVLKTLAKADGKPVSEFVLCRLQNEIGEALYVDDEYKEEEEEEEYDDYNPELRLVLEELERIRAAEDQELVRIVAEKVWGRQWNGAYRSAGKTGVYYRYVRPSGALMFVPDTGSAVRARNSFRLVAKLAQPKIENEIEWLKARKPKNWNWSA